MRCTIFIFQKSCNFLVAQRLYLVKVYNTHLNGCSTLKCSSIEVKKGRSLKYSFLFAGILVSANSAANSIDIKVNHLSVQHQPAVVVYLTPHDKSKPLQDNQQELVISQQDKKFAPYIAVTQRGNKLQFENKDDITHHIYSVSGKNNFELKIKAGENKLSAPLQNAEEVAMGCNIHDWMSGYVLVVDTPYYAKTNKQGLAQVELAHAGKYTLTVWHPQLDEQHNKVEQIIDVKPNQSERQSWSINLTRELLDVPTQENQDDFDFLEEYE